jgi:16S rRNA pseudouridine516 synthase
VAKVYLANLARPLQGHEAPIFASGALVLEGEDSPLAPARLEALSPTAARLTITEGRYHQVRRMFAAVGNHVEGLHRERVGALALPADLGPGDFARATGADLAAVLESGQPSDPAPSLDAIAPVPDI